MLLLGYVLCNAYVMEAWNTPSTKGDSAQLCYSDKIAGGRMMNLSRDLLFRS